MATIEALRSERELSFEVMMDVNAVATKPANAHPGFAVHPDGFAICLDGISSLCPSNYLWSALGHTSSQAPIVLDADDRIASRHA